VSVKIIACLNPVKNDRTVLEAAPGSIKDIIVSLNTGFPLSQARVSHNGEIIKDFSITAKDGDTLWIKFVPYGTNRETGIGMKLGGWALMIAGVVLGVATSWTGIGAFAGTALFGAGLGLALGGTVLLNVNIPSFDDYEKPDNDPSVRGSKNQSRPHGRIPVLFGRHRIYPDIAANPYTSIVGSNQYLTQLFCGGYKDYVIDIESFKLGDTKLVDLSATKNIQNILARGDPVIQMEILQNGEASVLYPHCVHEIIINAPLQHEIDDGNGGKTSGEIIRTTPDNTDEINVDIFLFNGIGKYNDKGNLEAASVEIIAYYKNVNEENYQPLGFFNSGSNTISGSSLKTMRFQITKQGLKPGKYDVKIVRETADSTESKIVDSVHAGSIRAIKTKDAGGNQVRPIRAERQKDLTIIALRVMATAKLNNVIDSFNYTATSKLLVHSPNGSGPLYWLSTAETQNPASMLLYALRGYAAQQQVDANHIDWLSIENFYAWCEEHNYSCNAYLSESVTIAELMRMIGNTARADILRIDSKISVVQDIERPSPVQLFTPKNSISYSITMFNADIPDAISFRFIDEDAGFAHNEAQVFNTPDGNRTEEPDTIQKADLWGITNKDQALRIGMYNYACLKNRPFLHSIDVDLEYLLCNKGDRIQYAGDIALTGSAQGRIKGLILADGVCVGIDTDEPVTMYEGQRHAVRIRLSDGTILLREAVFSGGIRREKFIPYYPVDDSGDDLFEPFIEDMYAVDEFNVYYEPQNTILFLEPLGANNVPRIGDIYAFGIRGYEVIDLIITDIQPGQNLSAFLTCVEYSPEIFGVDKPGFVLPDFINRISPVSGAVDSGIVNPVNWKHFALFNDKEEEPPRPGNDWYNNGWYQSQNFRSLWQSVKIAESMDSGEWGLPVRIKAHRGTDDITPIWLTLTPQNITLETDGDGIILAGLFPLTIQARLLQWNSLLTNVTYSILNAPSGITINANGLITVNASANLAVDNNFTVRAEYNNSLYTSVLNIKKDVRSFSPTYLGTVSNLQLTSAAIFIVNGKQPGSVTASQGDFVLAIAALHNRAAGSVFQWTGLAWEYRPPGTHSDLYMRCFKDGLDVPGLAQDIGWFGAVFAGLLVAQKGFIEELAAQVITLRKGGVIQSETKDANGSPLFRLYANGLFEALNANIAGHINAESGFINNATIGKEVVFLGTINSGPLFAASDTQIPSPAITFQQGARISVIHNHYGIGTHPVTGGSFGNINGLTIIQNTQSTYAGAVRFSTILIFNNGQQVVISDGDPFSGGGGQTILSNGQRTILQTLIAGGGEAGQTLRFNNLPTGGGGYLPGTVYRNGNQLMIV